MSFYLEFLTPERTVIRADVFFLNVPASSGRLTVLSNHAALMAELKQGEVIFSQEKGRQQTVRINSGLLQVAENKAVIVATES